MTDQTPPPRPDLGRAWSPIGTPVAALDGYSPAELVGKPITD